MADAAWWCKTVHCLGEKFSLLNACTVKPVTELVICCVNIKFEALPQCLILFCDGRLRMHPLC